MRAPAALHLHTLAPPPGVPIPLKASVCHHQCVFLIGCGGPGCTLLCPFSVPILQMGRRRLREIRPLAQGTQPAVRMSRAESRCVPAAPRPISSAQLPVRQHPATVLSPSCPGQPRLQRSLPARTRHHRPTQTRVKTSDPSFAGLLLAFGS